MKFVKRKICRDKAQPCSKTNIPNDPGHALLRSRLERISNRCQRYSSSAAKVFERHAVEAQMILRIRPQFHWQHTSLLIFRPKRLFAVRNGWEFRPAAGPGAAFLHRHV